MDLISLKNYLRARKVAPLQDMALHFQTEAETVRPLLAIWMQKGKVRKRSDDAATGCKGCCKCDPATIELYEWIE
ncbi:FeoC-like transcriptional regulator [Desulfobulbus elongatus]|uniref:FeoC-like transcriptional regulator n=1 Tax=Desulfobulbus elongatus TaxID=53332 RepID=UPI000485F27E|nr:FeoC-like transcriptional regulator [Desulfobulbus elongatus]